jgi:hypothetical protein
MLISIAFIYKKKQKENYLIEKFGPIKIFYKSQLLGVLFSEKFFIPQNFTKIIIV